MQIFSSVQDLKAYIFSQKKAGKSIGFVPTMGALHEGHLSLIHASLKQTDFTVVSLFVNPLQFGPHEDFEQYPRDLLADQQVLADCGVDVLFCPSKNDLYPLGIESAFRVGVSDFSQQLCGKTRPHFFEGVCTVVLRLFHLVQPDVAFFGQKDCQQALIIQHMVKDLFLPVEIQVMPIVREMDGLAMSSRCRYLSDDDRQEAVYIYKMLQFVSGQFLQGKRDTFYLIQSGQNFLIKQSSKIVLDYLAILHSNLKINEPFCQQGDFLLFAGVLGGVRLIDNVILQD